MTKPHADKSLAHYYANYEEVNKRRKDKYASDPQTRGKVQAISKAWLNTHMPEHRTYMNDYFQKVRQEVFSHYGSECAWCGETTYEYLQIDHTNNDGAAHRRSINNVRLTFWLRKNNYPKGFQLLCANCHNAKSKYGWSKKDVKKVLQVL